jgi:hypothetical protein
MVKCVVLSKVHTVQANSGEGGCSGGGGSGHESLAIVNSR